MVSSFLSRVRIYLCFQCLLLIFPSKEIPANFSSKSISVLPLAMIHILRPWKLSNFQDAPPPLSIYVQNVSTPLTVDAQFQTNPLSKWKPIALKKT